MRNPAEQWCIALESLLSQMVAQHQEMLTLLERKRDAMRRGDAPQMAELCALEHQKVRVISEMEKTRLELVAKLTLALNPKAAEPMRMAEVAERLPEPARGRLLVLRQQLRTQLEAVKQQTTVARRAAETLARHVQGLVQSVASMTQASTYQPASIPPKRTALSTFSMTA